MSAACRECGVQTRSDDQPYCSICKYVWFSTARLREKDGEPSYQLPEPKFHVCWCGRVSPLGPGQPYRRTLCKGGCPAVRLLPRPEGRSLILEDQPERQVWFSKQLGRDCTVTDDVQTALLILRREEFFSLIALDYDLNPRRTHIGNICTAPVAIFLRDHRPEFRTLIHSTNPSGVLALKMILPHVTEVHAFGTFGFESEPKRQEKT